ncbi:hypothetical protein KC316_g655 [Hortaea werneckii]|nr:hypothetical protein KC324_g203 [Hortaea werneckii]KAI7595225.1 hypothetical protein KC316_g655 [Hortaea werneckii]
MAVPTHFDFHCGLSGTGGESGVNSSQSGQRTGLSERIASQWFNFYQSLAIDIIPTVVIAARSEKTAQGFTFASPYGHIGTKDLLHVFQGPAWVNIVLFTEHGNEIAFEHREEMPKGTTIASTSQQERKLRRNWFVPKMNFFELCLGIALGRTSEFMAFSMSAYDFYHYEMIRYHSQHKFGEERS